MKSLSFTGIPGQFIAQWAHPELAHCMNHKVKSEVLVVSDSPAMIWGGEPTLPSLRSHFDLVVLNLFDLKDLELGLELLAEKLAPKGYFAMVFYHWPAMTNWFAYNLFPELKSQDRDRWLSGQKLLDEFLEMGRVQVVEREVTKLPTHYLEGVDLIKIFRDYWSSCYQADESFFVAISGVLDNFEHFLKKTNSNLDLSVESIFGIKEWE